MGEQGCRSSLSIGGDNLQFYPNFALFSSLAGMNLDHDVFQVSKLSEDQKKRSSSKEGKLCSPNCSGDLRSNAHQSQIIGGCRCRLYSNYWGGYSQIIGGIYLPSLPRQRNFFFYHGFADLLRHILCPNLQFRTPLSILT